MKVEFLDKFYKDLDRIDNKKIKQKIVDNIEEFELKEKLSDIPNLRKLEGFKNAYRKSIGDYRIGFFFENGVVELARIAHRKDIYRFFPK